MLRTEEEHHKPKVSSDSEHHGPFRNRRIVDCETDHDVPRMGPDGQFCPNFPNFPRMGPDGQICDSF